MIQSSDNATTAGTCKACDPGYASMGGLACNPCPVGFNAVNASSKQCNQCPSGSISVSAEYPYGYDSIANGNKYIYGVNAGTSCERCPAGYYQPSVGGQLCIPCAPGRLMFSDVPSSPLWLRSFPTS